MVYKQTLIITGSGTETFCAGSDLRYFATLQSRESGLRMSMRMQSILGRLWNGTRVVIAAVNGQALGGGCEILTACHFRIAASTASFAFRQAANGLITGWGGGVRLFHLVGRAQALKLLLTAERIDAAEALRIGLIDRVVSPDELMSAAFDLEHRICENSSRAIRSFLELSNQIHRVDFDTTVSYETKLFGDCWVGEDFRRALIEFLKGRDAGP